MFPEHGGHENTAYDCCSSGQYEDLPLSEVYEEDSVNPTCRTNVADITASSRLWSKRVQPYYQQLSIERVSISLGPRDCNSGNVGSKELGSVLRKVGRNPDKYLNL
jgi:hypothetical protein